MYYKTFKFKNTSTQKFKGTTQCLYVSSYNYGNHGLNPVDFTHGSSRHWLEKSITTHMGDKRLIRKITTPWRTPRIISIKECFPSLLGVQAN